MCRYGCGTGECFRPGVCRCPNGAYSPSCSGVQSQGMLTNRHIHHSRYDGHYVRERRDKFWGDFKIHSSLSIVLFTEKSKAVVCLWSNSYYPFFYIFVNNRCFLDIIPNWFQSVTTDIKTHGFFYLYFRNFTAAIIIPFSKNWLRIWENATTLEILCLWKELRVLLPDLKLLAPVGFTQITYWF